MTRRAWHSLGAQALGYGFALLVVRYLAGLFAAQLAGFTYRVLSLIDAVRVQDPSMFYSGNWLFFNVFAGALIGFFMYREWTCRLTWFVWVPFAMILGHEIVTYPQSVLARDSMNRFHHFFTRGCSEMSMYPAYISTTCADQILFSLPFYASVGFSIGVFLRQACDHRL